MYCCTVDIYDGETEPVIYHGKTLTSKLSLRNICETIARYAFATSPYPIIISAEVHCSVPQQVMIASIMCDVFGDALVKAPANGPLKITVLPSPEDLKGKVLLKVCFPAADPGRADRHLPFQTKNLYISDGDGNPDKDGAVDTESSSTETSASDTDFKDEVKHEMKHEWRKARANEVEAIKSKRYLDSRLQSVH